MSASRPILLAALLVALVLPSPQAFAGESQPKAPFTVSLQLSLIHI